MGATTAKRDDMIKRQLPANGLATAEVADALIAGYDERAINALHSWRVALHCLTSAVTVHLLRYMRTAIGDGVLIGMFSISDLPFGFSLPTTLLAPRARPTSLSLVELVSRLSLIATHAKPDMLGRWQRILACMASTQMAAAARGSKVADGLVLSAGDASLASRFRGACWRRQAVPFGAHSVGAAIVAFLSVVASLPPKAAQRLFDTTDRAELGRERVRHVHNLR